MEPSFDDQGNIFGIVGNEPIDVQNVALNQKIGVAQDFVAPPAVEVQKQRKALGLQRPYLLTVGTLEPRKNLELLIDLFEQLDDTELDLVVVGMPGWKCEPILERMQNSPKASQIHYLKYLPDGALPAVYAGAELFLLTSHYEGFGLPPLEAMSCGTPVISSAGGSLPEVLGDAAVILQNSGRATEDAEMWSHAVRALLGNSERRAEMVEAGKARVQMFRWEETARQTWEVYHKVMAL